MKKILILASAIACITISYQAFALDLIYQNSLDAGKLYYRPADSTFTGGVSLGVVGGQPNYSPLGNNFIYRNGTDNKLYVRSLNGTGSGTVFSNLINLTDPAYLPGGTSVVYANLGDGRIYSAKED